MSEKNYRIRTQVNGSDNVVQVSLKQGIKTLNILSLEIDPTDAYDIQTSDYGVIVGRVLANGAFGVPNVKVSAFIPISSQDEGDYIISNEYPYKTPQSRDINGVKYNLLYQNAGTFPGKRMMLDNDGCIEVFDKYWKYTTTTNQSGDYMLFGIPTGSTQVHYDCDLSDIGILSQHPYDFIAKGYNSNLFKSKTEFLDTEIGKAVHIISQDKTVYVYPFWGDKDGNKIGITRNDIEINYKFEPSCVFMGSVITDQDGSYIGVNGEPNGANGRFDSLSTSSGNIEVIRKTLDGGIEELKDNVVGIIDGNGIWCYQIPMNLDRIGTDEEGNMIAVNDPERGIPTRARVRFRISLTDADSPNNSEYTAKMLVPCNPKLEYQTEWHGSYDNAYFNDLMKMTPVPEGFHANYDTESFELPKDYTSIYEFGSKTPDSSFRDLYWGKVYSVKQYYPRFQYEHDIKSVLPYNSGADLMSKSPYLIDLEEPEEKRDLYNFEGYPPTCAFKQSCISSIDIIDGLNTFPYTTLYMSSESAVGDGRVPYWFYYHMTDYGGDEPLNQKGLKFCFENDWINGCLYFPRVIIRKTSDGTIDYFGRKNDSNKYNSEMGDSYTNVYISGRHHWHWKHNSNGSGSFKVVKPDLGAIGQSNDYDCDYESFYPHNESIFSRVRLLTGIVTKKKTMRGADVYYYRCGAVHNIDDIDDNITGESNDAYSADTVEYSTYLNDYGKSQNYGILKNNGAISQQTIKMYRRLYSTDIILLGNMEDIYDHLPKLYESLPDTTAIFPPVAPPIGLSESGMSKHGYNYQIGQTTESQNKDVIDIYGNWDEILTTPKGYTEEYSRELYNVVAGVNSLRTEYEKLTQDHSDQYELYERMLIRLSRRYSLFFGLRVWEVTDTTSFDIPTFVNTSRLCELDVHNDSAFSFDGGRIVPVNGMIDLYDISTNENRSAFATMNYDTERHIINEFGNRQYIPIQLVVNGFDGRLSEYIDQNYFGFSGSTTDAAEKYSQYYSSGYPRYAVDDEDQAYTKFRFKSSNNDNGPYVQIEYYPKFDYYRDITEKTYKSGNVPENDLPRHGFMYYTSDDTNNSVTITYYRDDPEPTVLRYGMVRRSFIEGTITNIRFNGGPGHLYIYSRWVKEDGNKSGTALWYKSYCHGPLYTPENSFYFYFGLRNGFSALDALKERYVGRLENEVSVGTMVNAKQIDGAFECYDGIALYQCRVNTGEAKLPVEWKISLGLEVVRQGSITENEDCIVSGLTSGNYNFEATDADGRLYTSTFGIEEIQVNISYEAYYDVDSNMPMLYFTRVENNPISQESHPIATTEHPGPQYEKYLFLSGYGDNDYYTRLSADTAFTVTTGEVINGDFSSVTLTFPIHQKSVNVTFTRSDSEGSNTCINNTVNIKFQELPGREVRLNNVPVKYLRDWTEHNNKPLSDCPDEIYNNYDFNLFDSINALDLTSGNTRGFRFEKFNTDKTEEMAYTSRMFDAVCGGSEMNLYRGDKENGFDLISIAPNFNSPILDNHYLKPTESWGGDLASACTETQSGMTVFFNESTVGNKDVPYIVGSNYPRHYNSRTLLLSGETDSGYVNNETFVERPNKPNSNWCGIDLFALKSKTGQEYDQPGPNIAPRDVSGTTTTQDIEVNSVNNYYGVRTVDKRLDYQFSVLTPLVLPSGYEDFPNLEKRALTDGSVYIDLYGGIRLNYSGDTKEITCYEYIGESLATSGKTSSYTDYWIERVDEDKCVIRLKKSEDGAQVSGRFSGNTVVVFDVSDYNDGQHGYVVKFNDSIGIGEPSAYYSDWQSDVAGVYARYLITDTNFNLDFTNTSAELNILSSSNFIKTNADDYLRDLNLSPKEEMVMIPEGATYLIVSCSGETSTPSDTIEFLSGFPSLQGKPQKNTIKENDEAKLYSISANEYYINTDGGESAEAVTLQEDKICVWYDNGTEDEFPDVDHVIYSASTLCSGTEMFKADFTSCSPLFTNGVAEVGETASVITTYKSGVRVVRHEGGAYDLWYRVDLGGSPEPTPPITGLTEESSTGTTIESETEPTTGTTSSYTTTTRRLFGRRNVRETRSNVEAFASLSGSSLEFTIEPDESWNGNTYTDIQTSGSTNHNGLYPEWASLSNWTSSLEEKPELSLCICYPHITMNDDGFNLYSACTLTVSGSGISYDSDIVISAVSGGTPLSDSNAVDKVKFDVDGLDGLTLSGDTFIIVPTRKVYTTPESPTLLKQGVVCNMGYVYFAGSIFVSTYESGIEKFVTLQLNTPLNDAESATMLKDIDTNDVMCKWHTIGEVEEDTMTSTVGILTYDKSKWMFTLELNEMSTDTATIYFSIKNGLKYRVDIVGLSAS